MRHETQLSERTFSSAMAEPLLGGWGLGMSSEYSRRDPPKAGVHALCKSASNADP